MEFLCRGIRCAMCAITALLSGWWHTFNGTLCTAWALLARALRKFRQAVEWREAFGLRQPAAAFELLGLFPPVCDFCRPGPLEAKAAEGCRSPRASPIGVRMPTTRCPVCWPAAPRDQGGVFQV